ncbi:homeodomain-interacting protein kinase 2-like [Anabas testudineus]|uniref:homeodomain-interacting protein kinase 2-like n=1 Tax=Anabas testudineus TaxID=64144 RepID=UPI000E463E09|nr:homeodomain-interacting protein kinase 2-like [Anabas testudineus]
MALQVKERDILHSDSTRYLVMNFSGEGCFGKVAKCLDLVTAKMAAVKILKKGEEHFIQSEVEMLEAIRTLDPDKTNIVRFIESFTFQNLSCLVFENLDRSLWDLMKERRWYPMHLSEIRPVIQQLLVAFQALKGLGIMHTDLKPDNVMLVNHKDKPFKIKLIDFGLALPEWQVQPGMVIQPFSYRAPEVTLGLPLSTAVDMWGVGCIMAHMYFGQSLFPSDCAYHYLQVILHLLGQPDHWHLHSGRNVWKYFTRDPGNPKWRLRTPTEYEVVTVRMTPSEAMTHNFVTMAHLVDDKGTSTYADIAFQFMKASCMSQLDETDTAEIATQDSSGNEDSEDLGLYLSDYSNTVLTPSRPKTPTFNFQNQESEPNSDKSDHLDNGSSFVGDLNSTRTSGYYRNIDVSSDLVPSTDKSSLPKFSIEDDIEPASSHYSYRESSTDLSSNEDTAATDHRDGARNTTTSSKDETGIAATLDEDNTSTNCVSASDPTDVAATATSSKDGAATTTRVPDAADDNTDPDGADTSTGPDVATIKTGTDGAQQNTFFKRARKFFGRMRKRVRSVFICGKVELADDSLSTINREEQIING